MSVVRRSVSSILMSHLSREQKLVALRNLEDELQLRSVAANEGMASSRRTRVDPVAQARAAREARRMLGDPQLDAPL